MKVFYRKELDGKIKELIFYDRIIDNTINLTVLTSHAHDLEESTVLYVTDFSCITTYTNMLDSMTIRLNFYGWNEDFDNVLNSKYNTYKDGEFLPSKVTRKIDTLENLKLPVQVHKKPKGYQNVFFNKQFRDLVGVPDKKLVEKANKVQEILRVPFNCYINEHEFIVHDVMMLDTPYYIRKRVLNELLGVTKIIVPMPISTINDLITYCKKDEVIIIGNESLYLPSFSAPYSYIYSNDNYNEAVIIKVTEDLITCLDDSFENVFTIKKEKEADKELRVSDVIKYKYDKAKTEIQRVGV